MAVISISRQVGSGGHEIAQLVARRLGYRLFDREMIAQLGAAAGLATGGEVIDLTAERHHTHSGFEQTFSLSPLGGYALGAYEASGAAAADRSASIVSKVMLSAYQQGNVVIEGRGSQGVLRGRPDVLQVRVVAPVEQRVAYVQKRDSISADAARKKVKEADAAQSDYIRQYFSADIADAALYDLIINTVRFTPEAATDLITQALACLTANA